MLNFLRQPSSLQLTWQTFSPKNYFTKGASVLSLYSSKFSKEKTQLNSQKVSSETVDCDRNTSLSRWQGLKHIPVSCSSFKLVDANLLSAGRYAICYNKLPLPRNSSGKTQQRAGCSRNEIPSALALEYTFRHQLNIPQESDWIIKHRVDWALHSQLLPEILSPCMAIQRHYTSKSWQMIQVWHLPQQIPEKNRWLDLWNKCIILVMFSVWQCDTIISPVC